MALFYTGKGDKGSSLVGKKKYPKDSPILEVLGDLDELNSLLGLIRSTAKKELQKKLFLVQENLFIIQARIAWLMFKKFESPQMTKGKIRKMEQEIDGMEKKIKPERGFIIPGENEQASWLDYARAVARRAERSAVKLNKKHKLPQELITYLNRLSSYLYALARLEISEGKIREKKPTYK
ncbi:cob(I)yrinic acid a,c-diamide adenosyltransferase [Patescibacteria group bacterium]|nr:cob(I)yrinic acid a,c-diamide adenosyltransferase [Patescibacteria group bacterium]